MLAQAAELPVRLVPVSIDIEFETLKIKDAFTWNLNGKLLCILLILKRH
jgi:SNF5 / SMARCB1 / INI1